MTFRYKDQNDYSQGNYLRHQRGERVESDEYVARRDQLLPDVDDEAEDDETDSTEIGPSEYFRRIHAAQQDAVGVRAGGASRAARQ